MSSYLLNSAVCAQQPQALLPDGPPPVSFAELDDQDDWALLGESISVRRLRSQIRRVAPYFRTAFLRGESGTGKEMVARAIHALSSVADGPFIVADARALAESLDRGEVSPPHSISDSNSTAAKVFESAKRGTVYITQVGELSFAQQAALFRFLQAYEDDRNGLHPVQGRMDPRGVRSGDRSSIAPPRILASSSRDLRTLAAIGQFRKDLYTRLSVLEITVPPLRERLDDIPILGERLLRQFGEERGQSPITLTESAVLGLQQHAWPDNLRELNRVLRQAAELTEGGTIEARHLSALTKPQATQSTEPRSERLHDVIQRHVLKVLLQCEGNKVRAAELLGISRSTLYRMLGVTPVVD